MPTHKLKAKVALVGDHGVGKTSLIRRFVQDEFDDRYIQTLGTKVTKVQLTIPHGVDTEIQVDMSIFDIIGQRGFRDMVKETFFHDIQGLLAVCDLTTRTSLDNLQDWIATALEIGGDAPVYILVNKNDLKDKAQFGDEAVSKVAKPWSAPYVYTSAKTGENVDDAFNALAIEIVNNAMRTLRAKSAIVDLEDRVLQALALRGFMGLAKKDLFERFRGISYDDLKTALERLERQLLVQIQWKGPADFTVIITPKGVTATHDRQNETSALSSV